MAVSAPGTPLSVPPNTDPGANKHSNCVKFSELNNYRISQVRERNLIGGGEGGRELREQTTFIVRDFGCGCSDFAVWLANLIKWVQFTQGEKIAKNRFIRYFEK